MALTDKQKEALEAYKLSKLGKVDNTTKDSSDFFNGISSGIDQTQATLYGVAGLLGDTIGSESLRNFGLEGYQRNIKEAQENAPRVSRIEDINGIGDTIDWAQGTLGQLIPSVATMLFTGGIGGAIAKKGAEKAVSKLAEEAIKKKVLKGQTLGTFAGSMGMETGSIYGGAASEGAEGARAIIPSIVGGAAAGALDALPVLRLGKAFDFGGELEKEITGSLKQRILSEGGKQALLEGSTEGLQTAIEEGTKAFINKRDLPEDMASQLMNAVAAGAIGGGVMGGATGVIAGSPESEKPKGPLERATENLETPFERGKNPVTGETYGYADIAKISDQLREIDERIKANPNAPGVNRLKEKAGALIDELQVNYLLPQEGESAKDISEGKRREAKDVYDFYRNYEGANSIEIEPFIETNDQKINRIMAEDEARIGKAERDQGTLNEDPQNISEEERQRRAQIEAEAIAKQLEDEQILEAQTKKLEEAIDQKAEAIVDPEKAKISEKEAKDSEEFKVIEEDQSLKEIQSPEESKVSEESDKSDETSLNEEYDEEEVIRDLPDFIPPEDVDLPEPKKTEEPATPVPTVKPEKAEETAAKIIIDSENKTKLDEPELEKAVAIGVQEKVKPEVEEALVTDGEDPKVVLALKTLKQMIAKGAPPEKVDEYLQLIANKTGREDLREIGQELYIQALKEKQQTILDGNANQETTTVQESTPSVTEEPQTKQKQKKVQTKLDISPEAPIDPTYAEMDWEDLKLQLESSATRTGIKVSDLKDLVKSMGLRKGITRAKKSDLIEMVESASSNEEVLQAVRRLLTGAQARKAKPKASSTSKKQKAAKDKLEELKEEKALIEEDPIEAAIKAEQEKEAKELKEPTKDGEKISKEELKEMEEFAKHADDPNYDLRDTGLEDFSEVGSYDDFTDFDFEKEKPSSFSKEYYERLKAQEEMFDNEGNFDPSLSSLPEYSKKYSKLINAYRDAFNSMVDNITANLPKTRFVFIENLSDVPESHRNAIIPTKKKHPGALGFRGLHVVERNGNTTIYINPHAFAVKGLKPVEVKKTFLHEFVGHYGLRKLFNSPFFFRSEKRPVSPYEVFLDKIAETNPEILREALNLRHRWTNIDLVSGLKVGNKIFGDTVRQYKANDANGNEVLVSISDHARRSLLDEYLAEKAKEFSDPKMVDKWTKQEKNLFKRFITWVKHKFKPIFKEDYKVTNEDVIAMIAQSYDNLYGKGAVIPKFEKFDKMMVKGYKFDDIKNFTSEDIEYRQYEEDEAYNKLADEGGVPNVTKEEAKKAKQEAIRQAAIDGVPIQHIIATDAIMSSGYADISESAVARYGTKLWLRYREKFPRLYRAFNPEGTLRNYKMKESEAMRALGKIDTAFTLAKEATETLKDLSAPQANAVMDYLTNDRLSVDSLNLSESQKRKLVKYKETLINYGQRLSDLGFLSKETFEKNKGKYLPARYLAYANRVLGSGRKASPLTYLMRRGDLSDEEKTILGELRDPQFILPEAISLIGRDVALLEYTKTIEALNNEKDLGWLLGDNQITRLDGEKMSITRAEDMVEIWTEMLKDYEGLNLKFNSTEKDIELIKAELAHTEREIAEYKKRLEERIRSEANLPLDQPIPENEFKNAVGELYKKMPKDRGYGFLSGQWVRKEIYDEFVETTLMQEDVSGLTKALLPGGTVDKFNQLWKQMKVPFNVPSWVRNTFGNYVLLDISTRTNSAKLGKMVMEEVQRAIKKDPSIYWQEAHKRGLFGTTYSSNEIFLLSETHSAIRAAQLAKEMKEIDSTFKSNWLKGRAYFMKAAEITSQAYGGLEGLFKTVAMRDYIEQWKKEKGVKSLNDLTPEQREAVVNRAVIHANEAIFDYSNLTAWQKDLRRNALGAPFLTYTFKALPAVVRGLARNPQKYIKYVALPMILSSLAISSLGDLTPDELEQLQKKMPEWMRNKSSVYILPWKDENGKIIPVDFGYYFPWAPWQDLATKGIAKFENAEGIDEYAFAALKATWEGAESLGLLGGPLPTSLVALLSNEDSFMNRKIVDPGASAGTKLAQIINYSYTLMAPPWLTNYGVVGRLMDHYDMSILGLPGNIVDVDGNPKETQFESFLRAFGVNTYPTTPEIASQKYVKEFRGKLFELRKARAKVVKNKNMSHGDKIAEIKDINRRIALLKKKYAGNISGK